MRGSRSWHEFYEILNRSLPKFNETLQLPFDDTQAMERLPAPEPSAATWPWNQKRKRPPTEAALLC